MSELGALLPFVLIALLFWLLILRPASRRQKTVREMQASLTVGDEVMLTSGFYARIVELDDDAAVLELAPGTQVKVVRGAIGSVVPVPTDVLDESAVDPSVVDEPVDQSDADGVRRDAEGR